MSEGAIEELRGQRQAMRDLRGQIEALVTENRKLDAALSRMNAARTKAQQFVDLFVWEPSEETGEIVPHLDRAFPDFNSALTELRDALAKLD